MTRYVLLAGVATAFAIAPTAAFAGDGGGNNYWDPITFENHVSTTVENGSFDYDLTGMLGGVLIYGTIDPDSAAHAITDAKQILDDQSVTFSDPGSSNNGKDDDKYDHGSSTATVTNTADTDEINADGNVGVNSAAGQYNMQQNSANMSVSGDANPEANGGWSSAATTAYQSLTDTTYGVDNSGEYSFDNNYDDHGGTHYTDTNKATADDIKGSGNIAENVAAGAFNQQQNLLTLAVANNSVLSQSTAALWQTASCNTIDIQNQSNSTDTGDISGSGNIGVNVAAGVGNQQMNSLTAAVSNSTGM